MEDLPGNSRKARVPPPAEKIERVTSAEAVPRKRGLGQKFRDTFFQGEDARSVMEHVFTDIIVPGMKDLFVDAAKDALDRKVYGESARKRVSSARSYSDLGRVDYSKFSGSHPAMSKPNPERSISRRSRARHEFNELIIQSRPEAEEVIERMFDILSQYGSVTVAHLYELTGVRSDHTDMKWGWTDLRGSKVRPMRGGGYLLDLPEPEPLN
jgi:hypothetical protein